MKKLIIVESIGSGTTKKTDQQVEEIVKTNKQFELFIYCKDFILNELGEMIRAKGIKILPTSQAIPGTMFDDEFDKIIAIDEWGEDKKKMFNKVLEDKVPDEVSDEIPDEVSGVEKTAKIPETPEVAKDKSEDKKDKNKSKGDKKDDKGSLKKGSKK